MPICFLVKIVKDSDSPSETQAHLTPADFSESVSFRVYSFILLIVDTMLLYYYYENKLRVFLRGAERP